MKQCVVERHFGLVNITIQTPDAASPALTLKGVSNPERVKDIVRQAAP